jgi:hypothetical protein
MRSSAFSRRIALTNDPVQPRCVIDIILPHSKPPITEVCVVIIYTESVQNFSLNDDILWPISIRQNRMEYNTTQHNTTQHNTTQHNTTQHNTTQHNTTQHNTTQQNKKNDNIFDQTMCISPLTEMTSWLDTNNFLFRWTFTVLSFIFWFRIIALSCTQFLSFVTAVRASAPGSPFTPISVDFDWK